LNQSLIASQVNNKYNKSEKENKIESELEILKAKSEDLKKCTESKSNEIIIGKKILEILEIGLLYDDQGKYEKALTYLNASFEMFEQAMPMKNVVNKIRLGFENQKKWYDQAKKKAIQTTDDVENLLKEKLFEVIGKKTKFIIIV
jgi:tetratricopeptide (TPR) repeat protein